MFGNDGQMLHDYYKTNFILMNKHEFRLSEIEDNMYPWERELYISLLLEMLEKEKNANQR
jgi:hypothetical protein